MDISCESISKWGFGCTDRIMIAGPCSAESPEQLHKTAQSIKDSGVHLYRAGIWKPRTRPGSFEGLGEEGLPWLKAAGESAGLPVSTEVAKPEHVEQCLKHNIDALWIGARTTTNPFAISELAQALKGVDIPVLVKNPVNPDIDLWVGALERIALAGLTKIAAVHRGFSTYRKSTYRNPPLWRIPIELRRRVPSLPLICDPSHLSGSKNLMLTISQTALDFLFDGLMIEVHSNPQKALSDKDQQLTPAEYIDLIQSLIWRTTHPTDSEVPQRLAVLRSEIDHIDYKIVDLLASRIDVVQHIADLKREKNITTLQLRRWQEILESRVQYGTEQRLSEEFITQLFELIHEYSLLRQEASATEEVGMEESVGSM